MTTEAAASTHVYQNDDGSYVDEFGTPVFLDAHGGFVYEDGHPVSVIGEGETEPVIYEDGHGGYVDEFGRAAFYTDTGHWVDEEGYLLEGRSGDATSVEPAVATTDSAAAAPSGRRSKRRDDYEDLAASDGCGARAVIGLFTVIAIVALAVGLYGWNIMKKIDPPGPPGAQIASFTISRGTTRQTLGEKLEKAGIITDAKTWNLYGKFAQPSFEAGEYTGFRKNMSFPEVIKVLDGGPLPIEQVSITFKEGITLADAIGLFVQKFPQYKPEEFWNALSSGQVKSKFYPNPAPALPPGFTAWEGLLFPNTYNFQKNWPVAKLLQKLVDLMDERLTAYGYQNAVAKTGFTPYQVLTVASMIEKETNRPEERAKVARVIYNRYEAGDFFGIDATTRYGRKKFTGPLVTADFDPSDPYSTRGNATIHRWPPTPICLPSEASIKAAIAPDPGPWKWYVVDVDNPTSHIFTDNIAEFNAAKARARAAGLL